MNLWKDIKSGPSAPEVVYAVIEIPKGSRNKYEYDKDMTSRTVADQILTLIRESGWKSPEEADFMCDICNMGGQP